MTTLTAGCLCGAVRFEVTEPFERVSACHCTTCKKISGGVGTASGRVPTGAIRIVAGKEHITTYQPDEGTAKSFCSRCGTNLFGGGWPESTHTSVRLPTLDQPFTGRIGSHIYVRSVAPWESLPDEGTERFDTGGA
jgi:hypothetical protein